VPNETPSVSEQSLVGDCRDRHDRYLIDYFHKTVNMANPPTSAPIPRIFLGWGSPALPAASSELVSRYRKGADLDLGRVVVVVPGQRAGRRLQELLVDAADKNGLLLTPPSVVTEGGLPERLHVRSKSIASPLVQRLAWAAAVRGLKPGTRKDLVPHPPKETELLRWLRIGEMLSRVHAELAADGHDLETVLREAEQIPGFADGARWAAIRTAQEAYYSSLAKLNLSDENADRLAAVQNKLVECDFDIILLGAVDLNEVIAKMLAQVSERVTAFVVAPEEEAERFDEFGRLIPESWQSAAVPIRDDQIHYADDPAGQAAAVASWLAGLKGQFAVEDVAIGIPDPAVVPALRRRLAPGVQVRWVEGRTMADSGPYRLLAAAAEYAASRRYEPFAELVRHPDVAAWLRAEGTSVDINALDDFHADHLPAHIEVMSLPESETENVRTVVERIGRWLAEANGSKPLREWADIFFEILRTAYTERGVLNLDHDPDRILHAALDRIIKEVDILRKVPAELDGPLPAEDAFAVAFEAVGRETVPPPAEPGTLELLGWLELPLDDAGAVMVTTFNEGHVPTAAGADPFLPDALRAKLGIEHNARRYARDAYAATVLAKSRRCFACVVARRNAQQDPLMPSRLLFTGPDAELIARANRWAHGESGDAVDTPMGTDRPLLFSIPKPVKRTQTPKSFDVTEFKTYLACKYRYYLRHVRKLSAVSDTGRELDGGAFGSLLHEVLQNWGSDPVWKVCDNAKRLAEHLTKELEKLAGPRFHGGQPAVRLQLAQAARRLRGFANRQAEQIAEGWQIVCTESGRSTLQSEFDVGEGLSVTLRGRIDRIDYHPGNNVVRILDYKTADKAVAPDKSHRKQNSWIDLQLPLYRHLWRSAVAVESVPANATVELAYFQIPREWDAAEVAMPKDWNKDVLEDADKTARIVIAGILAEDFWKPTSPPPKYFEDYAAICLDGLEAPPIPDDEEGGE